MKAATVKFDKNVLFYKFGLMVHFYFSYLKLWKFPGKFLFKTNKN